MLEQDENSLTVSQQSLLHPGSTLDHFKVLKLVGRGGMAEVYLARDTKLGRKVALKVVLPQLLSSKQSINRFILEAQATAKFNHPNIIAIYHVGEYQGIPYVALEYVEGQTLRLKLQREPLDLIESLQIALAIAEALKEAHRRNILHRDLKPENVLIDHDGRVRILDFGLAKFIGGPEAMRTAYTMMTGAEPGTMVSWGPYPGSHSSTAGGGKPKTEILQEDDDENKFCGTPAYMAPEQWIGQECTTAADIWSLGVMLYEMVAGNRPFTETSIPALCVNIVSPEPLPPLDASAEVPEPISKLIQHCLTKDPASRPSAQEVVEKLAEELKQLHLSLTKSPSLSQPQYLQEAKGTASVQNLAIINEQYSATSFDDNLSIDFLPALNRAAEWWMADGQKKQNLWKGKKLKHARNSLKSYTGQLSPAAMQFILAGQEHERQIIHRWLKFLFYLGSAFLLLALAASGIAAKYIFKEKEARQSASSAQYKLAREAWARGETLEARARLRWLLENHDSLAARALWWKLNKEPLCWKKQLSATNHSFDLSPDGTTIAIPCQQNSLCLINVQDAESHVLFSEVSPIVKVAFSPDGKHLAIATASGLLKMWDLSQNRVITLNHQSTETSSISFSADGTKLVHGDQNAKIKIWDVISRKLLKEWQGSASPINDLQFSPNNKWLSTSSKDGLVQIWEATTGRLNLSLRGHSGAVNSSSFSSSGRILASASADNTVQIWDLYRGGRLKVLTGHNSGVQAVSFSPGSHLLATAGDDSIIRIWDTTKWTQLSVLNGAQGAIQKLKFNTDGLTLVAINSADELYVWNLANAAPSLNTEGPFGEVTSIHFRPDGKILAAGYQNGAIRIWSVANGSELKKIMAHQAEVSQVKFSPSGQQLASASLDGSLRLWNIMQETSSDVLAEHLAPIHGISFSLDGKWLFSGGDDKVIRQWDLSKRALAATFQGHNDSVYDIDVNHHQPILASGSADKTIHLWDFQNSTAISVLNAHHGAVNSINFSPDSRFLVSGSTDGLLNLWQLSSEQNTILRRGMGHINKVAFHPDGRRIAIASADYQAQIFDPLQKNNVLLSGHRSSVTQILFNINGQITATASADGTVKLWDTKSGRPLWHAPVLLHHPLHLATYQGWIIPGHQNPMIPLGQTKSKWRLAIEQRARIAAEDEVGHFLCIGTYDGKLELWDMKNDQLLFAHAVDELVQVVTTTSGKCVTSAKGKIQLYSPVGLTQQLQSEASALTATKGQILVAAKDQIKTFADSGELQGTFSITAGVTALTVGPPGFIVGFENGNLELYTAPSPNVSRILRLEQTPSSPVVSLWLRPKNILVAGYLNGMVGIWNLQDGSLLHHQWLHGPVIHIGQHDKYIYAATELGQDALIDLGIFTSDYCKLMQQIWQKIPVIWEKGYPQIQPPPKNHHCRVKK